MDKTNRRDKQYYLSECDGFLCKLGTEWHCCGCFRGG